MLHCIQGHDTTAAGSSFFLSMMGIHQDIQDKVIDELDKIFGDSDRPATFQDTLEMKYLERCLMETLRLYPPVPIIARHLKQDITLRKYRHTFIFLFACHYEISQLIKQLFYSVMWQASTSRYYRSRGDLQVAPSPRCIPQRQQVWSRQLPPWKICKPPLLRLRSFLCWTQELRR